MSPVELSDGECCELWRALQTQLAALEAERRAARPGSPPNVPLHDRIERLCALSDKISEAWKEAES